MVGMLLPYIGCF